MRWSISTVVIATAMAWSASNDRAHAAQDEMDAASESTPLYYGQDEEYWLQVIQRKDEDLQTRWRAARALGFFHSSSEEAVKALGELLLEKKDSKISYAAAEALVALESAAKPALASLRTALKEATAGGVRQMAAEALSQLGAEAKEAVPDLIAVSTYKNADVRATVVEALGNISEADKTVVDAINLRLDDPDPVVRLRALIALRRLKQPAAKELALIVQLFADAPNFVKEESLVEVGEIGAEARSIARQVEALLKDPSVRVRNAAVSTLQKIDPGSQPLLAALLSVLAKDEDKELRLSAAEALQNASPGSYAQAVPALLAALKDRDVAVRQAAASALRGPLPDPARSIPALSVALKDEDKTVRLEAVRVLSDELNEKETFAAFAGALKDRDVDVRQAVAVALGQAQENAKEAAELVATGLRDPGQSPKIRQSLILALGQLGPAAQGSVPELVNVLKAGSVKEQQTACLSLSRFGAAGKGAVAAVVPLLRSQDEVRKAAVQALSGIGSGAGQAVPQLVEMLGDRDANVRQTAAYLIGEIGAESSAVLEPLSVALKDRDPKVRQLAVYALGAVRPPASAVPLLAKALADREPEVKRRALRSLMMMGKDADGALEDIRTMAASEQRSIREAALEAIRQIQNAAK